MAGALLHHRAEPGSGTMLYRWDSVAVEIFPYGETDSRASALPHDVPPGDFAHADPQHPAFIDLTDPDDQRR